jgi:hypothetical protein
MADSITVTSAAPVSLTVTVSSAASTTITSPASSSLSVTNKGPKGDTGDQGIQGIQGLPGVDGTDGQGVPTGGVQDQVIFKQSATDYDTAWDYIQTITEAVKNVSGGPLDKGAPLHVTGSTGNTVEVIAADATTNYPAHLILNEDLADEAEGRAVALGFINNVDVPDASIYSEGQTVYLGASGGWTTTKPTGTSAIQNLGVIVKVNVSGNKISGVVLGAGRANDVPNLPSGKFFIGSATNTTTSAYTLPTADGTTGQLLQTDGAGAVTFVDFSGSPWTTSGSDIYYTTGNVGVGTTTPSEPLDVVGDVEITGNLKLTSGTSSIVIGSNAGSGANVTYGVVIGKDAVSNVGVNGGSSSVTIGWRAGQFSGTTAVSNVFVGPLAGQRNTGSNSTVVGRNAGINTTGSNNVTVGYAAGLGVSGTSTYENTVAVGYEALKALTTGGSNTALGDRTSRAITSGSGNTSVGILGLSNVTTTSNNTSVGAQALQLTTGSNNTAVGFQSGNSITTSSDNALFGYASGIFNTGSQNVALGSRAMYGSPGSSTSSNTVAVGYQALTALTTGTGNTAVGYQADNLTTDGTNNTTLGYQATSNGTSVTNATALGYASIASNNSVAVGSSSNAGNTVGRSVAIGALAEARTYDIVAVGYNSGPRGGGNPSSSIFIGNYAGNSAGGNGLGQRVVIGAGACSTNGGGRYSIYIGDQAGRFGSTNNNQSNVMIGANAAYNHGSTTNSVGIGHNSMNGADTTGSIAIGWSSNAGDANYNIMIGYQAGNNSLLGGNNTMIGHQSGLALTTVNGANNVALGYQAGTALTEGGNNVLIGYQSGSTLTTESNKLYIENSNSATPLIYGEFDNDLVRINGDFEVTGGIKIEKTSNTDYDYRGDVVYFGATTGMTQGDLYYFNSSGNWAQADADAASSSGGVLLAIALGTASDTDGMLLRGTFTMEATAIDGTEATGDELYVSTTAGHITSDVSAYTTGDVVRVIGYCLDGTNGQIWFNPSNDFITLA